MSLLPSGNCRWTFCHITTHSNCTSHFNFVVEKNPNRHIEATRHKTPKYFRDSRIEYELQWGASNLNANTTAIYSPRRCSATVAAAMKTRQRGPRRTIVIHEKQETRIIHKNERNPRRTTTNNLAKTTTINPQRCCSRSRTTRASATQRHANTRS